MPNEQATTEQPTVWPPPPNIPDRHGSAFTIDGIKFARAEGRLTIDNVPGRKLINVLALSPFLMPFLQIASTLASRRSTPLDAETLVVVDVVAFTVVMLGILVARFALLGNVFRYYLVLDCDMNQILGGREERVKNLKALSPLSELAAVNVERKSFLSYTRYSIRLETVHQPCRSGIRRAFHERLNLDIAYVKDRDAAESIAGEVSNFAGIPLTRSWQNDSPANDV